MSAPNAKALKYASKPPKPKSYSPEARVSYLSKRLASQVGEGHLRQALKTVDQRALPLSPSLPLLSSPYFVFSRKKGHRPGAALLSWES